MFQRITNLFKGFLGLFISGLEKRNPEALLEVEKENLRKQMAQFNQGLAAHAGLCEKLMSQVKRLEKQEQELKAKAAANLRAGNQQAAGELALELQATRRELADNTSQLGDAEKTYKELVGARDVAVKAARSKIESLRRGIDDLKMQRALAEMNEMAGGMLTKIGGSGDTLDRLHEMVEDERTRAAGRSRVAR
ncbi:MAG TPA: PspA/IM30 family protein, partial [Verrucomicrobium sp.]|nr:PspA/IM30 family protein [Verrucomicrobium sp.]